MLQNWVLSRLETIKDSNYILVRDPMRLFPEADRTIHTFGRENGFTVIVAATNLVFRELYEHAVADPETKKLLVIDRAPLRRRINLSIMKAPPPFYPDLLSNIPSEARVELDLQQFLKEITGDPNWPTDTNEPRYARLITKHLDGVLQAHKNLRNSDPKRFTDADFRKIVAYAALGIANAAFKKLDAEDYWKIGLIGHEAIEELDQLVPEITKPIKAELEKAPAPYCWFAQHDPAIVIRAFYLSVILAQHTDDWSLLLANIDPALKPLSKIDTKILHEAAPKLININSAQASKDLEEVERSLDKEAFQFLLIDQLKIVNPESFTTIIEKERYSTLIRSLALLLGLDNLLSTKPLMDEQKRIEASLFSMGDYKEALFVDARKSIHWPDLKEAYRLASDIHQLKNELAGFVKNLKVINRKDLSFKLFREAWNDKRINRLEYYLPALERLVYSGNLLPCLEGDLPSVFSNALNRIQQNVRTVVDGIQKQFDEVNKRFQEMVSDQYPQWVKKDSEVFLTSQFIRRCLKAYWDPQNEKAVLFIFDGMRYDIWDEFLWPMLSDRFQLLADLPASSILPSETHITRKAISAGTYPDEFDTNKGEDKLLKESLIREFGFKGEVRVVPPKGGGVGETVRYQAGNLNVYILDLCDKELHKVSMKTLPDGRMIPSRPLSFIYKQHIQNIIDTEMMAIVRDLPPNTKVFVTADHGFGRVGREPLWFEEADLNENEDCSYLNCWLRVPIGAHTPAKVRDNIIVFTPEQLRIPKQETRTIQKTGQTIKKEYKGIAFPRVGYSFSRKGAHYNPDAYSHGGISIQEMMIPMVVLKVRPRDEGLLRIDEIAGPTEVVEGEEIEFKLTLNKAAVRTLLDEDLRVDVEATYSREPEKNSLPQQVVYVTTKGETATFRFMPASDEATPEERKQGIMERTFTVTLSYHGGKRLLRQLRTKKFTVQLNSEKIIRRVGNLGSILGLTPKSMR
jgi:hypothetical protein